MVEVVKSVEERPGLLVGRTGAGRISKIFAEWDLPWWSDGQDGTKYLGGLS